MAFETATGLETPKDEFTLMLEGMNKQELVKYGQLTYALNMTAAYTKHELQNAIKDAASKFKLNEQIRVGPQLSVEELPPGQAEIQLHRTDNTKKMKSAIVGLNGKFASLPIGVTFWCPLEFVEILNNAVQMTYDQDTSTQPPTLIERPVHSYPFTIHRVAPHTPESSKKAHKLRGLQGRKEGETKRLREKRYALG